MPDPTPTGPRPADSGGSRDEDREALRATMKEAAMSGCDDDGCLHYDHAPAAATGAGADGCPGHEYGDHGTWWHAASDECPDRAPAAATGADEHGPHCLDPHPCDNCWCAPAHGINGEAGGSDRPWQAGDPCGGCGSTDTYEGLPHEGAQCRACGAGDDDD